MEFVAMVILVHSLKKKHDFMYFQSVSILPLDLEIL